MDFETKHIQQKAKQLQSVVTKLKDQPSIIIWTTEEEIGMIGTQNDTMNLGMLVRVQQWIDQTLYQND